MEATMGKVTVSLVEVGPDSIPWDEVKLGDKCWIKCIRTIDREKK